MHSIIEQCCQFGEDQGLGGILTFPTHNFETEKTSVVMINAGLVPKQGPFRLYTELARKIADQGIHSFRFDLSGIGDSPQKNSHLPLQERTRIEIKEALDYLQKQFSIETFILTGLCSGAEDSFRYAENDPRVKGVILIDPFSYPTFGYQWRHLFFRLRRRVLRAVNLYRPLSQSKKNSLIEYKYMSANESSGILKKLIKRKVRIHFIYTGGMIEAFNHKGQLRRMFPKIKFRGLVSVDHLSQIDHTQTLKRDRNLLIHSIRKHLQNHQPIRNRIFSLFLSKLPRQLTFAFASKAGELND